MSAESQGQFVDAIGTLRQGLLSFAFLERLKQFVECAVVLDMLSVCKCFATSRIAFIEQCMRVIFDSVEQYQSLSSDLQNISSVISHKLSLRDEEQVFLTSLFP